MKRVNEFDEGDPRKKQGDLGLIGESSCRLESNLRKVTRSLLTIVGDTTVSTGCGMVER